MEPRKELPKRIGFWLNEKKCKKFNVPEFVEECRKKNMEVIKLLLHEPLQPQGPFDVILHKITPIYAQALDANQEACLLASAFEQYLLSVPSVPVVDPVPALHTLLHRPATYALLHAITAHDDQVMTPPYVELPDTNMRTKKQLLAQAGVTFPIVCKPVFGCGGTAAHELAVVLSASRLTEWQGPCVAQSFVQHGAVLYKLYVLGDAWHLVVRPSLKNFRATDAPTVHFNSSKVSKADSCSPLTQLDQSDRAMRHPQPDNSVFDRIVRTVRESLSMDLLGIDVVIDSSSGQYAIIDVNPFPSYDSIADLMPCFATLLFEKIQQRSCGHVLSASSINDLLPARGGRRQDSAGIDIPALLRARGHLPRLQCGEDSRTDDSHEGNSSPNTITQATYNTEDARSSAAAAGGEENSCIQTDSSSTTNSKICSSSGKKNTSCDSNSFTDRKSCSSSGKKESNYGENDATVTMNTMNAAHEKTLNGRYRKELSENKGCIENAVFQTNGINVTLSHDNGISERKKTCDAAAKNVINNTDIKQNTNGPANIIAQNGIIMTSNGKRSDSSGIFDESQSKNDLKSDQNAQLNIKCTNIASKCCYELDEMQNEVHHITNNTITDGITHSLKGCLYSDQCEDDCAGYAEKHSKCDAYCNLDLASHTEGSCSCSPACDVSKTNVLCTYSAGSPSAAGASSSQPYPSHVMSSVSSSSTLQQR